MSKVVNLKKLHENDYSIEEYERQYGGTIEGDDGWTPVVDDDIGLAPAPTTDWITELYEYLFMEISMSSNTSYLTYKNKRVEGLRLGKTIDASSVFGAYYNVVSSIIDRRSRSDTLVAVLKEKEVTAVEVRTADGWFQVGPGCQSIERVNLSTEKLDMRKQAKQ